jgi:hypothetical protein
MGKGQGSCRHHTRSQTIGRRFSVDAHSVRLQLVDPNVTH